MDKTNRTVISRRSRPAKDPLSRDVIVKTALALLKAEGSPGMSMRKIAKELDTGPSSLYVYVTNSQELASCVLDAGLDNLSLPEEPDGSWSEKLFDALHAYLMVLYESPGIAELALTTIPVGPNSLALTEYILARLQEGGITSTSAAWGADLLLLYASSVAFEQSSRDRQGTTLHTLAAAYESLDPARYPRVAALRNELISGDDSDGGQERFRWGLEAILQGILLKKQN